MTHTFTDISVQPYTNQTTFTVDESVQKIDIYFKVSFADGGTDISCVDGGLTRYVQAQVTTPSGAESYGRKMFVKMCHQPLTLLNQILCLRPEIGNLRLNLEVGREHIWRTPRQFHHCDNRT